MPERRASDVDNSNSPPPDLLAGLTPTTDLAWLVDRVCRSNLPWVVVPQSAVAAWEERDPAGWAKVRSWLAERNVTIVRV